MLSTGAFAEWYWACPHCGCEETSETSPPSTMVCDGCDEEYEVFET